MPVRIPAESGAQSVPAESALAEAVRQEIAQLRASWQPSASAAPISTEEREVLLRGGFTLMPLALALEEDSALAATAQDYEQILATSRSIREVAAALNATEEDIVNRLQARTLYGVTVGQEQRLPAFQFETDEPLRSIERVFPCLDPDLHPVEVYRWFTSVDPDLTVNDESFSPREWLRSGGDAAIVCEHAASLSYPL